MSDCLTLQNVRCGYTNGFQLQNISFSVPRGVFAGIIGPNGSGKTTLFKSITGELPVKTGRLLFKEQALSSLPLKEKAREIAVVSQFTENTDITVEDYVLSGRLPYRSPFQFFETAHDYDIAHEYMELTDTLRLKDQRMSQLSGGEQQLADIARALAQQPSLLLLDEPTSHLDISHQVQILNLLQRLITQTGLTVLMIIHDLNLASEYCDYLVLMKNGSVYQKGSPVEVITYAHIEEVYNTVVITQTNPLSKKPAVFLVSEKMLNNPELLDR